MKSRVLLVALLSLPAAAWGQARPTVTLAPHHPGTGHLSRAQVALTAGGLLIISSLFDPGVEQVAQQVRGETSNALSRVGYQFGTGQRMLPLAAAAWLAGAALGHDRWRDAAGHAFASAATAGVVVTGIKFIVGRARPSEAEGSLHFTPFHAGDSSFPSGHAAIAFGLASALAREIPGSLDDVGLYGAATLTGLSRINDNRHWLTDVLAGAAVGITAGRWVTRGHRVPPVVAVPGGVGLALQF